MTKNLKPKKLMKRKHVQKRRIAYATLLTLPPVLALAMIAVVSFTNKAVVIAPEGIMLSPMKDSSPLILSLTIFIFGYLVFIGLLFKDSIKNIFPRKALNK